MAAIRPDANGNCDIATPFVANTGKVVRVPIGVADNSDI
jgi:hypothetical protein